jgi:hypothetical protein
METMRGEVVAKLRVIDSVNRVLRDVDYYTAARMLLDKETSPAWKALYAIGGNTVGGPGYILFSKIIGPILNAGFSRIGVHTFELRTDPDKPNSPIGGFRWVYAGTCDSYHDEDAGHCDPKRREDADESGNPIPDWRTLAYKQLPGSGDDKDDQ